ncbi:unnamed protein product [Caenorhabditis bovis]|uniref:Methyltransferase type 11 domain-containing protein n=1 Tax=Caenorhabditis bovis TaxID=2654633 RepID=A0A8S1EST8_9PELO|nr:unnamed protein product [Caenorhabditis bovis]
MIRHHLFARLNKIWLWIFDQFILYPLMSWIAPTLGVHFMNLGYWPNDLDDTPIQLFMEENCDMIRQECDKPHLFLYEKLLSLHPAYPDFENLSILEVSCGQGYGIDWIDRTRFVSIIGCDKIKCPPPWITYGDAHDLPFESSSMDMILNVEASHLYANFEQFLNECHRVLKPDGFLCWTDLRFADQIDATIRSFTDAGFHCNAWQDITNEVIQGIHKTSQFYDEILDKSPFIVKMFRSSLRATYCAPGTATYNNFAEKRKLYTAAVFKKELKY